MAKIVKFNASRANDEEIVKKIGKAIGRVMEIDYEEEEMSALDLNEPGCTIDRSGHVINLQLCFAGIKSLDKITPLIVQLKKLRELKLNSNKLSDISSLSQLEVLKQLNFLDISNNAVSDLSALSTITTPEHFYAGGNPITDISPLSGMVNLTELFLHDMQVGDISPLKGMKKMEHMILDRLEISNISVLQYLANLNYLQLSNNNITDISPLKYLQHLRTILIDNNKIEELPSWILDFDLDILWKITHTRDHICVGGNPIKNPPVEVIQKGNEAIAAWFDA